jgi:thiol-disulfide isomerase/thioredoxin
MSRVSIPPFFWLIASVLFLTGRLASAATPTAEQALKLVPIQKNVDYDRPNAEEIARCKISARKIDGHVGWVVEDGQGNMLRRFTDTNGDNMVDQWSYYKDGVEVYRDLDSNFNGKADQYRWFHMGGSRWGLDKDEDGVIESWKVISAEEVAAEAIAALATQDAERFTHLLLTASELKALGLGETRARQLADKIGKLSAEFDKVAAAQKGLSEKTRYVQFSETQPGTVPAGTDGSTKDLLVYENAMAVIETEGKHAQVQVGTLVRIDDNVWRLIDVPRAMTEGQGAVPLAGFFFRAAGNAASKMAVNGATEGLADLDKLDKAAAQATTPEARAEYNARRADMLEKIIAQARSADEQDMWTRQLADWLSATIQSGSFPDGTKRLQALFERLKKAGDQKDLMAYVRFRELAAENAEKMQAAGADVPKLQAEWVKTLQQFVEEYPKAVDASEAMLQLAMNHEFSGQEDEAKRWYGRIVSDFPDTPAGRKAAGARTRLDCVGKTISLRGKSTTGDSIDLASHRGDVVVVYYWATWCQPCKGELPALKELVAKYGKSGLSVIGVSLDYKQDDLTAFLAENRLPWPQIWEEGALDSPPANQLGIVTLPTMLLLDRAGKVVSRNVRIAELDTEVKKLLK